MESQVFNFSAGPAVMPAAVLERAKDEIRSVGGIGMSVMEISHRSRHFGAILDGAEQGLRDLLNVPDNFRVLFLQGGASLQFSMIPMNFIAPGETADYIVTGFWGRKALTEANRCGDINVIFDSSADKCRTTPGQSDLNINPDARYLHYVANETIEGVEFKYDVDGKGVPVVCDMSSNILSKSINWDNYAVVYNGAQKNIGPSGIAVVFMRDDMFDRIRGEHHTLLDYRAIRDNGSMANTPNTWAIYMVGLVCDWLKEQGGVEAMQIRNEEKANLLYNAIDNSDGYFTGHASRNVRSTMNVSFHLPTQELDTQFCSEAEAVGLDGLAGHRSLGGVRASIYNAMPREGVVKLVEFMHEFAQKNG
ncbi:MAG TPA: 3-phosphoserine/phosphohydroxythreonine transaminase [Pyrinomonadaceae bacterium]|nr:3-phosphoserine/phosphohydroxythreonine transaminase [Pyrinomonadaceae bacterium]